MIELRFGIKLGTLDLDVDVALPSRGVSAIFGRSGAGKSSLINAVAGIVQPTRGRISVGDRVFFDHTAGIDLPIEATPYRLCLPGRTAVSAPERHRQPALWPEARPRAATGGLGQRRRSARPR
jgi:energy-coupling factor transporter ATP-binding protein EcfA2